jgi:PAS domain S-box-containing protein
MEEKMAAKHDNLSREELLAENADLRNRLEEAEETLRAIREGEVDAIVVSGSKGDRVFSLTETENLHRLMVETMSEAGIATSLDGVVLYCNQRTCQLLGVGQEQIFGHKLNEFAARHDAGRMEALLATARTMTADDRIMFVARDGSVVPMHVWASHLDRPDGVMICLVGTDLSQLETDRDVINQLHEQQRALRASEEQERQRAGELAALLDAVPTPVFIAHDPDCAHLSGNLAASELLRLPAGAETSLTAPAEARPRHFRAVKDGRQLSNDELPAQRAARGQRVQDFEFDIVFDDGETRHVVGYGTPLMDGEGHPRGAVHVLVDITQRRRAEEELRRTVEELTRFNRAMVDRELRMLELKREVNELCVRAGEQPRYRVDTEASPSSDQVQP